MKTKNTVLIKTAKTAGFCFGVRRAINLAEKIAKENSKAYTLGPLIHNPQEVKRLEKNGIKTVESPWKIGKSVLILRTHGVPEAFREKLVSKKLNIVDATCPFVKRAQDIVKKLAAKGRFVVIVGDKTHPEVIALVSYGHKDCCVVESQKDIVAIKTTRKIGVVSQTTQSPEHFEKLIKSLKKRHKVAEVYNTICRATVDRQSEAKEIAKKVDVMLVVGGKNSGNTRRLYEISKEFTKTYLVEKASEIKVSWLKNVKTVGLTAGASTPDWIIENVENKILNI